mgnify:CR=1 FL=1
MLRRPLVPVAALLWGLQAAFLSPALALILVSLYGASAADVGWVLAIYNAGGFVASLVIPAHADRKRRYLPILLVCGCLTLGLAAALAVATSLPLAAIALVVLGGPASVGNSLLFAYLMDGGATTADVVNTRAVFSFSWVAGPPIATALIGWFGSPSVLVAIAIVAVLNVATTLVMLNRSRSQAPREVEERAAGPDNGRALGFLTGRVLVVVVAFILAQATNAAAVAIITLFVTQHLHLPVIWAGIAAGLAAGLEIPALMLLGKLSSRYSELTLLLTGCAAGVGYYAGMVFVSAPAVLLALQVLNAWFFAAIAGIGLTLFQKIIPRPGLANGLYANTRRVGAILAGPVIAIAAGPLGYPGVYAACAGMTLLAAIFTWAAARGQDPDLAARAGRSRPHPPRSVG